ncbi:MAG: arylsulfatase [Xanthomonadales bacterium]|nr:arylsulfatase [Xanthomonadales bacterium]
MHQKHKNQSKTILSLCLLAFLNPCFPETSNASDLKRLNVIIILADDMGFTDLGTFGSEIATPNLDQLAQSGIRLTNFHMMPSCQPSRAVLLTGADNHIAGMGSQEGLLTENQKGQPGYELRITDRVESVVAQLQSSGYQTFMSGKWHLGEDRDDWPDKRGFEHWFSLLQGGGSHLDPSGISPRSPMSTFVEDGEITEIPADFYSSDFFTTKLLDYLRKDRDPERPFFAYLAFTAPHWPLHARREDMQKYQGRYDSGYEELRRQRIKGAQAKGVIPKGIVVAAPETDFKPWVSLSTDQQAVESRKMEVYAAMVHRLDWNIGRLMAFLQESGEAENTIVIFTSDNGAEGHQMEDYPVFLPWIAKNYDNQLDNVGHTGSYTSTGPGWAHASMGAFRWYKGFMSEGGTRSPAIVHYPGNGRAGATLNAYASVADFAPTLLDWAGVEATKPETLRGRSMARWLEGKDEVLYGQDETVAWELFGRRAAYRGDWKLLWQPQPYGLGDWELFNIQKDPGESQNLAADHADIRDSLVVDWQEYARRSGVILPNNTLPY